MKGGMSKKYDRKRGVHKVEQALKPQALVVPVHTPFNTVYAVQEVGNNLVVNECNSREQATNWAKKNGYRVQED
jgi:hypothetical protein